MNFDPSSMADVCLPKRSLIPVSVKWLSRPSMSISFFRTMLSLRFRKRKLLISVIWRQKSGFSDVPGIIIDYLIIVLHHDLVPPIPRGCLQPRSGATAGRTDRLPISGQLAGPGGGKSTQATTSFRWLGSMTTPNDVSTSNLRSSMMLIDVHWTPPALNMYS